MLVERLVIRNCVYENEPNQKQKTGTSGVKATRQYML